VKNIKIKKTLNHGLRGFIFICAIAAITLAGCGGGGGPDGPDGPGDDDITVSFSLGEGVSGIPPSNITIKNNTAMGTKYPSSVPKRTGYDFEGWFNSDTQYTKDTVINVSTGKTFLLTARWKNEDDAVEDAQNPAIHPGEHFLREGLTRNVKVNEEFAATALFANVEKGAGVLSSKWYRVLSKADADASLLDESHPRGTVVLEQTAPVNNPHEISLPFRHSEPAAGIYYYYVIVINTNEHATVQKTSSSITLNYLTVTVTD